MHHTESFYPLFHLITEWVIYEAEQNYRWGNDAQDLKFRNKPNLSQVMEHTKCILKADSTVLTWPTLPYISRNLPETITRNLALLFWNSAAISHIQSYSSSRCSETCPSIMPLNQRAMHLSFLKFHKCRAHPHPATSGFSATVFTEGHSKKQKGTVVRCPCSETRLLASNPWSAVYYVTKASHLNSLCLDLPNCKMGKLVLPKGLPWFYSELIPMEYLE